MKEYFKLKQINELPRIPIEGMLDVTYRCNNNCRHCWLRIPSDAKEADDELSCEEIMRIVDESRKMGCNKWSISGGEPMIRNDFEEIFEFITKKSVSYSINTNGTMITPKIAKLLRRRGNKMVALYGANADVHDHITRNPGSFEAAMQGMSYLKEVNVGFTVQIVPMKDNYYQMDEMIRFAKNISDHWRILGPWLYLSGSGDSKKNKEIIRQRLSPKQFVKIEKPDMVYEGGRNCTSSNCLEIGKDDKLFTSCIKHMRSFHIDPYGKMTFCQFIKNPRFRYDIQKGNIKECWEEFIPSIASVEEGGREYIKNCYSCKLRKDCYWCPAYAYLEHGKYNTQIKYLCQVAKENRRFKDKWNKKNCRSYQLAEMVISVESEIPLKEDTFHSKFKHFETNKSDKQDIIIRHHFTLPEINIQNLGKEIYRKPPWLIYKTEREWVYMDISLDEKTDSYQRLVVFNYNSSKVDIYTDGGEDFIRGGLTSLSMLPSDQIIFAKLLADKRGFYLHSCGVDFEGRGLLFAGIPDAGKSTIATFLKDKAKILCDDRMIIRRWPDGFKVHGTWSHGDVTDVSSASAPLKAIFFIEKAQQDAISPITNSQEKVRKLILNLIKPLVTIDWWEKTLDTIEGIIGEVPLYNLYFNKSGEAVKMIERLEDF